MRIRIPLFFNTAVATTALLVIPATSQADDRLMVELNGKQQEFVLNHMRSMLETIGAIQQHLADGNPEQVAEQVKELKAHERAVKPKGIGKSFPPGFRAMSKTMNQHWKVLLQPTTDDKKIQQELHLILNQCNACHRSYQLKR